VPVNPPLFYAEDKLDRLTTGSEKQQILGGKTL
jgi:hypothetical protein